MAGFVELGFEGSKAEGRGQNGEAPGSGWHPCDQAVAGGPTRGLGQLFSTHDGGPVYPHPLWTNNFVKCNKNETKNRIARKTEFFKMIKYKLTFFLVNSELRNSLRYHKNF